MDRKLRMWGAAFMCVQDKPLPLLMPILIRMVFCRGRYLHDLAQL